MAAESLSFLPQLEQKVIASLAACLSPNKLVSRSEEEARVWPISVHLNYPDSCIEAAEH
jgi:hypothetical protein